MASSMRRVRLGASVAALALALAACGGGDNDGGGTTPGGEAAAAGGEFSLQISEPEHLVPTNTNESEGSQVLDALFTGLVSYDNENKPVNEIAESITSEDQQTWTVKIKSGWTFHNGEPVDAASFVNAWNYGAYAPNAQGNSYFFENIQGYDDLQSTDPDGEEGPKKAPTPKAKEMTGLKVVDATTFTVALKDKFSQFPLTVGYTAFYPLPKAFFGNEKAYEEAPIGNGPYQMDGTWEHNKSITVKKYPNYKGQAGNADRITFKIYTDVNTAYLDAQGGNLDIVPTIPPERITSARTDFPGRFFEGQSSSFTYIGFPLYNKKFANPDLRRAFSMAIDRDSIVRAIFNNTRRPARSIVSPVVPGFREDACGENCRYDPAKAKQLFDQAGGYSGTLTMWFNSGAGHDKWVEAASNNLRTNLGIQDIKFEQRDFAQYLPLLDDEKITGPFRLGWVMDYPSPQNYLQPIFGTTGSSNNFGYSNPEADRLIQEGNAAESIDAGIAKYQQAEDLILRDMPAIPMFFGLEQAVYSDRVANVTADAFGRIRLGDVQVVKR